MEISSVQQLCETLIYYSIQRCRILDDLCRLSVAFRQIPASDPPLVRVSVSDTGAGSCLEELQELRYSWNTFLDDKWDGVISVATTNISDAELHSANVNLKEVNMSTRLTRLPSSSKNGATFSGTEVSFVTSEILDELRAKITFFLQKMSVLKYPNSEHENCIMAVEFLILDISDHFYYVLQFYGTVRSIMIWSLLEIVNNLLQKVAIETLVNYGSPSGSEHDSCILALECNFLPFSSSYLEYMRLGLENYILQHGNRRDSACNFCFPSRDQLKVGVGQSFNSGLRKSGNIFETVIIISKAQEQISSSCSIITDDKTEVLYFENFIPSSISQSYVEAFTSIKWENYGLTLKRASNQDGHAFLEWDNLPPQVHIGIGLHCYRQQVAEPLYPRNCKVSQSLSRKAIIIALNELKEKNEGILLSTHAVKICTYAPDLAKTISHLVLSSNDLEFKGECFSLLGIQEMEENTVESCIREKIVSAVGMNDMKSRRNKEAASILFNDYTHNTDNLDVDYEDEESNYLDL